MKTSDTNRWRTRSRWGVLMLVACLLPAAPLAAQESRADEERREHVEHLHWVLEGLERGIESLAALERHDGRRHLEEIAHEVRRELEHAEAARPRRRGGDEERRIAEAQADVLRLAMRALLEAERRDAAELVERAIHARELMLEGRNDPEAREIRQNAPSRRETVELLVLAERLYREFDLEEMADRVSAMTEELWDERTGRGNARARGREGGAERERAQRRAVERERRERERGERAERERGERAERAERNERRRAERGRRGAEGANEELVARFERLHEHLMHVQREMEALRRELEHRGSER